MGADNIQTVREVQFRMICERDVREGFHDQSAHQNIKLKNLNKINAKTDPPFQKAIPSINQPVSVVEETTALRNIEDDVLRATDQGKLTVLILIDFSRGLATINYSLLISILKYIGF